MKSLLIASATALVIFSSCSVYREGQTPDDVYYSPGRSQESAGYVAANGDRDDGRRIQSDNPTYNGYDDYATPEDRWLMMRVRDRYRWSYFDNYNMYNPYSPFGYNGFGGFGYGGLGMGYGGYGGFGFSPGFSLGLGLGYGSYGFYDPLWGYPYYWNSYYNPYYPKYVVVDPKSNLGGYGAPRNFNSNAYSNRNYNNSRPANGNNYGRANQGYNNTNNNRTLGNSFRRMFSNSNNATTNSPGGTYRPSQSTRPVREYSPGYNNSNNNSGYSPRNSGGGFSGGSSGGSSGSSSSGSRPSRR